MKSTHTQSRNLEGLAKPSRRHLHNVVAVLAVLAGLAVFGGASAATAQNAAELNTQLTGEPSAGAGRVVALYRHHSGIYLPGD